MRYTYNDARGNVVISNKTVRENAQTTGISHNLKKNQTVAECIPLKS